jgi:HPt (histidine-containing phosphotransfer) domain-containing protein
MTAGVLTEDRERALAAGMDDYVAKPVKPEQLEAALARWVPDRRSPRPTSAESPGDAAENGAQSVLDRDRVVLLRGLGPPDGRGILPALVDAFMAEAPTLVAAVAAAVSARDAGALNERAHRFRGAALNLGVLALADACAELEAMGRSGALVGAEGVLSRVETETERGSSALRAALAEA